MPGVCDACGAHQPTTEHLQRWLTTPNTKAVISAVVHVTYDGRKANLCTGCILAAVVHGATHRP